MEMASRASLGMLMAAHGFPAACAHRKASGPVGTVGNNVLTSVTGVGSRRAHRRPARLSTLRFSGGDCMASHMLPKPTSQAMGLVEDSELASAAGTPVKAPSTTIVVGGGPTGLATAIMLARLGYQGIHVRSSRRIHSGLMLLIMVASFPSFLLSQARLAGRGCLFTSPA